MYDMFRSIFEQAINHFTDHVVLDNFNACDMIDSWNF